MSKITKSKLHEILSARNKNNPYSKLADIPKPDSFKDIKKYLIFKNKYFIERKG